MPATLQRRPDGALHYVTGSMGSGKTTLVRQATLAAPRALYWDGKGIDWGARERCRVVDLHQLRAVLFAPTGRYSVRVQVSKRKLREVLPPGVDLGAPPAGRDRRR